MNDRHENRRQAGLSQKPSSCIVKTKLLQRKRRRFTSRFAVFPGINDVAFYQATAKK